MKITITREEKKEASTDTNDDEESAGNLILDVPLVLNGAPELLELDKSRGETIVTHASTSTDGEGQVVKKQKKRFMVQAQFFYDLNSESDPVLKAHQTSYENKFSQPCTCPSRRIKNTRDVAVSTDELFNDTRVRALLRAPSASYDVSNSASASSNGACKGYITNYPHNPTTLSGPRHEIDAEYLENNELIYKLIDYQKQTAGDRRDSDASSDICSELTDVLEQYERDLNGFDRSSSFDSFGSVSVHTEDSVDLIIDNGMLVEQPEGDQMYRESPTLQRTPSVKLTSRKIPIKNQNIIIEMRSKGEVPVGADIDSYLSAIDCKDLESSWQHQKTITPMYTSFEQIIVQNSPTEVRKKTSRASSFKDERSNSFKRRSNSTTQTNGLLTEASSNGHYRSADIDSQRASCTIDHRSGRKSFNSDDMTFNKDIHDSLQQFCDGLITGLFDKNKRNSHTNTKNLQVPKMDNSSVVEETTIKINTDLKPIKKRLQSKNADESTSETASCRVFKCDKEMLKTELQETLKNDENKILEKVL